jgi:hypothetical protein
MGWTWRYEDPQGDLCTAADAPGPGEFATQGDAESWLGESWRELLDSGVAQVSLLEDGRTVYRMGLDAPR